jgi:hypothetical protein
MQELRHRGQAERGAETLHKPLISSQKRHQGTEFMDG